MGDTASERADAIVRAIDATRGQGAQVQRDAVQFLMYPPRQQIADQLWRFMFICLLALLLLVVAALLVLISLGKNVDVLLTLFTTTFAGLIGLNVPRPA